MRRGFTTSDVLRYGNFTFKNETVAAYTPPLPRPSTQAEKVRVTGVAFHTAGGAGRL